MPELSRFAALLGLCWGALWAGREFVPAPDESYRPDELVLRLKDGASLDEVNRSLPVWLRIDRQHPRLPVMTVKVPPGLREQVSRILGRSPLVEYVEAHHMRQATGLAPTDTSYSAQWWLTKLQAADAWSLAPARFPAAGQFGGRVRVAVLDTGADCAHPDFINTGGASTNVTGGGQFSYALSQAIVATSAAAPACPWQDDNGHGTHVAGILAAATNNGTGVAALGFPAELVIYKVLDGAGSGSDLDIATAITAAADAGARVISLSLGGTGYSQLLQDAVDYAWRRNALVVAAAGNSASGALFFPAGANFVLGVGATDASDARASFSNYGFGLDVMAPGVGILSTAKGGGYVTLSGTSMATPQVSALAALILTANPGLAAEALAQRILRAADPLATGGVWSSLLGYGRVNAWRALSGALPARSVGGVAGQVVDAVGVPVSGALVSLAGTTGITSPDGLFRFVNFPAGLLAFQASASGQPARSMNVVTPAGADALLRVELRSGVGTFTGSVLTGSGTAVEGAAVQALQASLTIASASTDSAGGFSLQVPAGTYDLRASAPGQAAQLEGARAVAAGGVTVVNFNTLALGRVSGTVRNAASTPLAGVQVTVSNDAFSAGGVTDAVGQYTTLGLPAGTYTVSAALASYTHTPVSGVNIAAGATVALDLTLTPSLAVSALTLSPATVGGGAVSTKNSVKLSAPAGPAGAVVSLSSSNPAVAQTPAAVTVPAGATVSPPFTITTSTVAAPTPVTITATAGASSKQAVLNVVPFQVTSVSLSPQTVAGGVAARSNRVFLNAAAPPAGAVVTLTSSNPALAAPPASVTVPAGTATSGYFTITTATVTATTQVVITASYAGTAKQATLTLTPPALYSFTASPLTLAGGRIITNASVRLTGPAPAGGVTVTLQASSPLATPPATVIVPVGVTSSPYFAIPTAWVTARETVTVTAAYAGVQKSITLTLTPVALSAFTATASVVGGKPAKGTVTLDGPAPAGGAAVVLTSADPAVTVPPSVTVASGSTWVSFTILTTPVAAEKTVSLTAASGGVSRSALLKLTPAALAALSLAGSVTGGKPATGTVSLSGPAVAGGQVVTLSSSSAAASVPASVTVAGGAWSAVFALTTAPVAAPVTATITASSGGVSKSAPVTVRPPAPYSLRFSTATVKGGNSVTAVLTLDGAAPPGGLSVALLSTSAAVLPPASVLVPAGSAAVSFNVSTAAVAVNTTATLSATASGVTRSANLTVTP